MWFSVVGLDIQDEMGRHEVGHIENSMKIPLSQGGGCRFEGEFVINKVSPFFHPVCPVGGVHAARVWIVLNMTKAASLPQSLAVVSQSVLGPVGLCLFHLHLARHIFQDI